MKNLLFPEDSDPLRHFSWRAEGGWRSRNTLDVCAFLAFRHFGPLAEGGQAAISI
jgi:hypothetical protein